MAAQLEDKDTRVETCRGTFGELRVTVDGRDAYDGNRLWYARPRSIVAAVRAWMGRESTSR